MLSTGLELKLRLVTVRVRVRGRVKIRIRVRVRVRVRLIMQYKLDTLKMRVNSKATVKPSANNPSLLSLYLCPYPYPSPYRRHDLSSLS
jgi:hypothetical protein